VSAVSTAWVEGADWTDANQAYLVAELARIKARLRGAGTVDEVPLPPPVPAAIDALSAAFSLSAFERDVLLLCAGVEMDGELAALAAEGTSGRPQATFGLALAVLADPHWSALTPVRPLRRWRLVEPCDDSVLVLARLRIDERILHLLAGVNYLDPRLQPLLRLIPAPEVMAASQEAASQAIARAMGGSPSPVVQLTGNDRYGKRDVAASAAARCGRALYALSEQDLPSGPHDLDALATLWERETLLLGGALLVECGSGPGAAVANFVERAAGPVLVAVREPLPLARADVRHRIDKPDGADQARLWASALNGRAERFGAAVDGVASEFRLSAQDIARVAAGLGPGQPGWDDPTAALWQACRAVERVRLDGLAQRIESAAGWDDLVLPEPQKATLRQIGSHVRHRITVYERWGFGARGSRGLGISVLFSGESGTGKTMAAEVLAHELHLDLYRIDLSAVVSKYIGETEKNLARVFDAAEAGGVILLFDEADALFGKRSEVKDSHDRYANIEISYLLARMEAYRGLAILTTNQKSALDAAFQRRLRFVVHFPFPGAEEREQIWRRIFPAATPTAGLAYDKLAHLPMPGGHIRNVALDAAFRAAEEAGPVGMEHLLRAAHAEAAKRERGLTDAETRGWT